VFSIGLINIAKHRGKYEFEVSFSESINTAISFKIGTDKFYTIFSGGINYFLSTIEYAPDRIRHKHKLEETLE
jgi:transposase